MAEEDITPVGDTPTDPPEASESTEAPSSEPPGTIASGASEAPSAGAPATWPDDWRQRMAKELVGSDSGDAYDKEMKILERMASPFDAYKGKREQDRKISSGELKSQASAFPAEGSEEEQARWRSDNGIPAEPKGYEEHLDGIVMGDETKPLLDLYLTDAHAQNIPPDYVKASVDWYLKLEEQTAEAQQAADTEFHNASVNELKSEYGGEYDRNMVDLNNWLNTFGEGVAENLLGARLADGTLLGDNPAVLKAFIGQMRQINPLSTVVPGGGTDGMQTVEAEIAEIQRLIATEPQKYWADKQKQDRFQQLIAARDGYKQRAAG